MRVCVVGGGTAGAEAAREAARSGAQVVVIEKSQYPDPPWRTWPDLLLGDASTGSRPRAAPPLREAATLRAEARAVGRGSALLSDGTRPRFDVAIIAAGSGSSPVLIKGARKPGVHQLRTAEDYRVLGRRRQSISRAVVAGEGARALEVADRLSGGGRVVIAVVSHWRRRAPGPEVLRILGRAAEERGVSLMQGCVDQASGVGALEAVVVGGAVIPAETLLLLPDRTPRVVPCEAKLGHRGLSVDQTLRTSSPRILAAGGSAELLLGGRSRVLDEEPGASGRIAGANSLGRCIMMTLASSWDVTVFGLRWSGADLGWPALSYTRSASTVTSSNGASACTLTYIPATGRVVRAESVEPMNSRPLDPLPVASGVASLRSLAYYSSSDISLVSDTARLGLQLWSDSLSATTSK